MALPAQSRSISAPALAALAWFCVDDRGPNAATCAVDGEPFSQRVAPADHFVWAVLEGTGLQTSHRDQSEG